MTTSQPKRQPIPFGKYLLLDRVNIGGMAEVWRGKQFGASGFERLVAIKRILPNIAEDEEFISMFIDEAKISVQLSHANIAQIYELGQITSSYFISMEYIPGKDMRAIFDRCRKKGEPAPVPLVAFCLSKMCEGLDYAHRKKDGMGRDMNIVHRDISPQNVLISFEGEVKVIDFGIAKAAGKATKTQAGILKGKFGYMSPEQIRGLPLDRRSDVFAIGVCLYEMLTGERLFVGDSDFSVLEKVRKAEVPPPSTYNRRIPEALEKIVMRALAKDVDERYQYASELGDDLQRFLITSETIFGRKDLMQYMKSTFAEEVEREKQRLSDYADIRPPDGMLAALEASSGVGPGGLSAPPPAASSPSLAQVPVVQPVAAPPRATAAMGVVSPSPSPVRRSPTLAALPKLTAATAAPTPKEDEVMATQLVSSDHVFDDSPEPTTDPGASVGRTITPLEARATQLDEDEENLSGKTAVIAPIAPPSAPRLSHANIPVVTASAPQSSRPSVTLPTVIPSDVAASAPGPRGSRGAGDGLPRIARDVPPPDVSQGISRAALPPDVSQGISRAALAEGLQGGARATGSPPMLGPGAPSRPPRPVPQPRQEEDDFEERPTASVPALNQRGLDKRVLYAVVGVLALVVLSVVGWVATRPGVGYVMLDLQRVPQEVRGRVQVMLDTQPVVIEGGGPTLLREVQAGPVMVTVSAEGYKTFTRTLQVNSGKEVSPVEVTLESLVRTASLVLVTHPSDAQVKVDGKVVREQGRSDAFIKGVVVSSQEWVVEVSAPQHKPVSKRVQVSGEAPAEVNVKLEPLVTKVSVKVESRPEGAVIFANGEELGETPQTVLVSSNVRRLTLKLKCHNDVEVEIPAPAAGESIVTLPAVSLKKQLRCR
ncbi:serine/threonine protein kinase [Myxococcus stipitatus DSM 14675]|uniref:Serine/threonine protein kinase n=1 Tax=Myxococcus stipitatus (strain DSM 14675 / JCM 12634 / Mx s8) TaxID=1278073 RepID=L7UM52_MYXSD|nr:serine/threonine-protein kinase [Myxococcus stipitatus]AGC47559.1 serine/threonine protein kinase [Myxococcus stipitatus DSM 14675]